MHIGLFGGTFNPIHRCHLAIAQDIQTHMRLDHILFIPSGDPPHKPPDTLIPAIHRLEMVKAAIATHPTFSISDIEIRTSNYSYTIDTVTTLKEIYPANTTFSFLVGLDAFLEFPSWKQSPQLLKLCHFIVCERPGSRFEELSKLTMFSFFPFKDLVALDAHQITHLDHPLSSTTRITLLSLPACHISSSMIRHHLREGFPVSDWLPPLVESYILSHQLYRSPTREGSHFKKST